MEPYETISFKTFIYIHLLTRTHSCTRMLAHMYTGALQTHAHSLMCIVTKVCWFVFFFWKNYFSAKTWECLRWALFCCFFSDETYREKHRPALGRVEVRMHTCIHAYEQLTTQIGVHQQIVEFLFLSREKVFTPLYTFWSGVVFYMYSYTSNKGECIKTNCFLENKAFLRALTNDTADGRVLISLSAGMLIVIFLLLKKITTWEG